MDLGKILDKKGLEAKSIDDRIEDYSKKHRDNFLDFKGYEIPMKEFNFLREILSEKEGCWCSDNVSVGKDYHFAGKPCATEHEYPFVVDIKYSHITRLKMKNMGLGNIPESIGNFSHLRKLNLNNNQLTSLPESICELKNLEKLSLISNKLTSFPEPVISLCQLKELYLGRNNVTSLPDSIGNLSQLQHLSLQKNYLTSLPDSIGNLSELRGLYLWNNQLTSLPDSITNLENLQYLYLGYNRLDKKSRKLVKSLRKAMRKHWGWKDIYVDI